MYRVMRYSPVDKPQLVSTWDDEIIANDMANLNNVAYQTNEYYVTSNDPEPRDLILDRQTYEKEKEQWLYSDR